MVSLKIYFNKLERNIPKNMDWKIIIIIIKVLKKDFKNINGLDHKFLALISVNFDPCKPATRGNVIFIFLQFLLFLEAIKFKTALW